jgi:hypothetical protein
MRPDRTPPPLLLAALFAALSAALASSGFAQDSAPPPDPTPASDPATAPVEPAAPEPFPIERYQRLIHRSPFAPSTQQATEEPKASFADELYVTGIAKLGEADCVFLSTRDKKTTYSLVTGDPPSDGIQLLAVEWSDQVGKTKVRVKKGTETGVLSFDQAVVQQTASAPQMQPNPGSAPNLPRPPGQPNIPGIQPGTQIQPGNPAQPQPTVRRRFRIINKDAQ